VLSQEEMNELGMGECQVLEGNTAGAGVITGLAARLGINTPTSTPDGSVAEMR